MDKQKFAHSTKNLQEQKYQVSYRAVGEMLKTLGYGLQANKKTLTLEPSHPDRDAQFEYLNSNLKSSGKG